MTDPESSRLIGIALAAVFPLVFGGLWFGITVGLGALSGWYALARRFPDREDDALAQFAWQSARLGRVRLNNALTFTACRSGLRVKIMPLLGPFSRPFFVPWAQIGCATQTTLFGPLALLELGAPTQAVLTIYPKLAARLARAAGNGWPAGRRMLAEGGGQETIG